MPCFAHSNSGKFRSANCVHIVKRQGNPLNYSQSWNVATVCEGNEHSFDNFDNTVLMVKVKFVSVTCVDAVITVQVNHLVPTISPAPTPLCANWE
jgi:hypothetical protein